MAEPINYQLTRTANAIPDIFIGGTFNEIKRDLLDWLRGQNDLRDYDFEGWRVHQNLKQVQIDDDLSHFAKV